MSKRAISRRFAESSTTLEVIGLGALNPRLAAFKHRRLLGVLTGSLILAFICAFSAVTLLNCPTVCESKPLAEINDSDLRCQARSIEYSGTSIPESVRAIITGDDITISGTVGAFPSVETNPLCGGLNDENCEGVALFNGFAGFPWVFAEATTPTVVSSYLFSMESALSGSCAGKTSMERINCVLNEALPPDSISFPLGATSLDPYLDFLQQKIDGIPIEDYDFEVFSFSSPNQIYVWRFEKIVRTTAEGLEFVGRIEYRRRAKASTTYEEYVGFCARYESSEFCLEVKTIDDYSTPSEFSDCDDADLFSSPGVIEYPVVRCNLTSSTMDFETVMFFAPTTPASTGGVDLISSVRASELVRCCREVCPPIMLTIGSALGWASFVETFVVAIVLGGYAMLVADPYRPNSDERGSLSAFA